jgi:hypothetical protein
MLSNHVGRVFLTALLFVSMLAAIAISAAPALADVVNLRCAPNLAAGENISLKIDYGTRRVTIMMDIQPGVPRRGNDTSSSDGSLPAQISDALVAWTVPLGEYTENYQLDRYTGALRYNRGSGGWKCQIANPSSRKF